MGNEFTNEWYIAYIARQRSRERDMLLVRKDIPDPGLESNLQRKVLKYGKDIGLPVFHDRSRGVNEPGWSDNFFFLPATCPHCERGKVVLIELKSESGTFRKEQKELRLILYRLGHKVYSARSFKRVVEIIEREREGKGGYDN